MTATTLLLADTAPWLRCRKTALAWARVAPTAGVVETLEGPVAHAAGDAICRGPAGERWPIGAARFATLYTPAGPVAPDGWRPYRRLGDAWAQRQAAAFEARLDDGTALHGEAGDWLLRDGTGRRWVVAADIFAATWALVDDAPGGRGEDGDAPAAG